MRVGVVMPTWQQGDHIFGAVRSLLEQEFKDFVLCIVLDGPPDDGTKSAVKLVARLMDNVHFVRIEENEGTANAINVGHETLIEEFPEIEYLTWVSSDNEMDPEWLTTLVKFLDENPEKQYVFSSYTIAHGKVGSGDRGGWSPSRKTIRHAPDYPRIHPNTKEIDYHQLDRTPVCFIGPSFLYRQSTWNDTGPHRGVMDHDYDWWLRVEETTSWAGASVQDNLCEYRDHPESKTRTRGDNYSEAKQWRKRAKLRRLRKVRRDDSRRSDGDTEKPEDASGAVRSTGTGETGLSQEYDRGGIPRVPAGEGPEPGPAREKRTARRRKKSKKRSSEDSGGTGSSDSSGEGRGGPDGGSG